LLAAVTSHVRCFDIAPEAHVALIDSEVIFCSEKAVADHDIQMVILRLS